MCDGLVGLGPYVSIVGWVGLGEEKWTHVHLCMKVRCAVVQVRCNVMQVRCAVVQVRCVVE